MTPLNVASAFSIWCLQKGKGGIEQGDQEYEEYLYPSFRGANNCNLFDKKLISSNGQSLTIVHSLISNAHNVYAVYCCKIQCMEI